MRTTCRLMSVCLLLAVLVGCASPVTKGTLAPVPEVVESEARYRWELVIVPGDEFDVVVRGHPEVTRSCLVRPDGFITLPMLDDVRVAGHTFKEVDALLTEKLSARIDQPDLSVIATKVREAEILVFGEVLINKAVPLREALTAAHAIASAGGFRESARRDRVNVIRLGEDGRLRAVTVNVALEGQPAVIMALQQFPLRANDIVFVPRSGISQFGNFMRQYVNEPLTGINSILGTYVNYKLIQELEKSNGN